MAPANPDKALPEVATAVVGANPDRCRTCFGKGSIEYMIPGTEMQDHRPCDVCDGSGKVTGGGPDPTFGDLFGASAKSYYRDAADPPVANDNPVPMKPDPVLANVINDYFDAHIERRIVGNSMTGEAPSPMNERRQCVLWIGERDVLGWVKLIGRPDPLFVTRPVLIGLPNDVMLYSVRHDWERRAFGFVLESALFDPIPDGDVLPRYGGRFGVTFEAVRLAGKKDDDPFGDPAR